MEFLSWSSSRKFSLGSLIIGLVNFGRHFFFFVLDVHVIFVSALEFLQLELVGWTDWTEFGGLGAAHLSIACTRVWGNLELWSRGSGSNSTYQPSAEVWNRMIRVWELFTCFYKELEGDRSLGLFVRDLGRCTCVHQEKRGWSLAWLLQVFDSLALCKGRWEVWLTA